MSQTHLSDLSFEQLDLVEPLMKGVREAGFERCTLIQAKALPMALAGRDVGGQAQTGTGKTAAFLLGMFQYLIKHPASPKRQPTQPRALVLAPTRELAVQIYDDAQQLGKYTGFRFGIAFGGTDYEKQRRTLQEGVDLLIGTPGRIIDYFKQGVFDLRAAQVLVLDEADRMFDLGFIRDIRYLLRRLPPAEERLNMLFSATLGHRVLELAYEHMNDPELVQIEPEKVTADLVRQAIYFPSNAEKIPLLLGLLNSMDPRRTMVFVNTKRAAEQLQHYLEANGVHAEAISGDVPQRQRLRMLRDFVSGELPVLIGTDVASRGLHVPDVSHVFNFDLPQDAEDYVHRIGRTARAGKAGDAISFGCEDSAIYLPEIEAYIGHSIEVKSIEPGMLAELHRPPRRPRKPPGGAGSRSRRPASRSRSEGKRSGSKGSAAKSAAGKPGGGRPRKRRRRSESPPRTPTEPQS